MQLVDGDKALDALIISALDVLTLKDIDPFKLGGMFTMFNIADLMITSLETITSFKLDGTPWFILDELHDATIANTQEKEDLTGKGGRKLGTLKRNKAVTISGTNGLVSGGLLEVQTGGEFKSGNVAVSFSETLVVNASNKATTSYKAVGTAGAEIEALYTKTTDGRADKKLEQDSAAAAGKFAYDPATKELTFTTDVTDGTEIIVFYTRNVAGDVLHNNADKFSGKARLIIDAFAEDKCSNVYRVQIEVPKADFSGDFDLAFGENQTVHAFEASALAGAGCGKSGYLWNYTVFGANAEDAA